MLINTADQFGFYQVGNYRSYSKVEAVEYAVANGHRGIHWNFNDSAWSSVDATKEPVESLSDLYEERCRQIRSAYDYVVIFYSGGSDSHNILTHWLKSGCKLDEVAVLWRHSAVGDYNAFSDVEQYKVAIPRVKELQKKHSFKFRLVDQSQDYIDYILNNTDNLIYNSNRCLTPVDSARTDLREKITEWKDLISAGKRVCFVWGLDKLRFTYNGTKLAFTFVDLVDSCVPPGVQRRFEQGWYDELFYWSPSLPKLSIKQAHVVKNFFNMKTGLYKDILHYYQKTPSHCGFNKHTQLYLSDNGYRKLMYPFWDQNTFTRGKSSSLIMSPTDQWLWDSNLLAGKIFKEIAPSFEKKINSLPVSINTYPIE